MKIQCKYSELVDPDKLTENPKNPNKHSDDQINRLSKLIDHYGFRHPIIVSKLSNTVIAGHGRLAAAKVLKLGKVPVDYQAFKDEDEEYMFMVSDNAIQSDWAELDLKMITSELDNIDYSDIDLFGFKDLELPKEFEKDEDEVPTNVKPRTKLGDLYQLGEHRLLCGDSAVESDVDCLTSGLKMDLCFTDPPYGVSYEKKTKTIINQNRNHHKIHGDDLSLNELKKIIQSAFNNISLFLKEDGSYYVCSPQGGELGLMMMMMLQEACIPCRHMIIWSKNAPVFSMGRLDYDYQHEPILYGWKKKHNFYGAGEFTKSIWNISREQNKLHPTMKPVKIIENVLLNSSKKGDSVIDLFGGSGSTLIACEKTNRKCFMMEIDPYYVDIIIRRWEDYTGKKAKLIT